MIVVWVCCRHSLPWVQNYNLLIWYIKTKQNTHGQGLLVLTHPAYYFTTRKCRSNYVQRQVTWQKNTQKQSKNLHTTQSDHYIHVLNLKRTILPVSSSPLSYTTMSQFTSNQFHADISIFPCYHTLPSTQRPTWDLKTEQPQRQRHYCVAHCTPGPPPCACPGCPPSSSSMSCWSWYRPRSFLYVVSSKFTRSASYVSSSLRSASIASTSRFGKTFSNSWIWKLFV